jgi:hypothetical protein
MDLLALEFGLIFLVITAQVYLGIISIQLIRDYKNTFVQIPTIEKYKGPNEDYDFSASSASGSEVEITLLKHTSFKDGHMKMVNLINKYLYNNHGAVIDYHFIKEIVDRERSTAEDAIDSYIPSPLYFGLAATMIGIIIGLFGIDFENTEIGAIKPLIDGVKMAMVASVCGLAITTYLSVFAYRSAKTKVDAGVNSLLSLIQIELLPSFHKDENSSLELLSKKLDEFGRSTAHQVGLMEKVVSSSKDQIDITHSVISKIGELDLSNIAGANIKIFKQLSKMMESFQSFPAYYSKLNESLGSTTQLVNNLNKLNERSQDVSEIFNDLKAINSNAHNASKFFSTHVEQFSEYGKAVNRAVQSSDEAMQKAIETFGKTSNKVVGGITEQMQTYDNKFTEIITNSSATFVEKAEGQRDVLLETLKRSSPEFSHLKELSTIKNELTTLNTHSAKSNSALNDVNTGISKLRESFDNNSGFAIPVSGNIEGSHESSKNGFKSKAEQILRLTMYSVVTVTALSILGVMIYASIVG